MFLQNKLQVLRDGANGTKELNEDQKQAIKKYDGVIEILDFLKELNTSIASIFTEVIHLLYYTYTLYYIISLIYYTNDLTLTPTSVTLCLFPFDLNILYFKIIDFLFKFLIFE